MGEKTNKLNISLIKAEHRQFDAIISQAGGALKSREWGNFTRKTLVADFPIGSGIFLD
jgi:hypothetical protein